MAKIIGLPKLSPTMEEGTLVRWVKQEGDEVQVDDLLAEVETDKATMEFRSFDKGVLLKILAEEGETLTQDAPVAIIGDEGEDISELLAQVQEGGAPSEGGEEPSEGAPAPEKPAEAGAAEREPREKPPAGAEAPRRAEGRVLASPLVRKLARERDLDLRRVEGSGPGGRIIKRDLDAHVERGPAPAAPGERPAPRIEKASATRRTIARRLGESKREVPHYYLNVDLDAAPLMAARAQINRVLASEGRDDKVSVNDLLIKACGVALRRYPRANAAWIDDHIHYHQRVDVSVAVAIPEGLLTPVVRDADQKGVLTIAHEMRDLSARAREKRLAPEEMTDGTFSISNLGMYGIESFSAVINPPEGAILAVGTVRDEPVVQDGQIVPGKRMRMTLSADHRVIDGAVGAEFMAVLRTIVENPASLLL